MKDTGEVTASDMKKEYLKEDIKQSTETPIMALDSVSYNLKVCVDQSIEGIDVDKIRYYSKIKDRKLLVLLKVGDMKKIQKESRKELVYVVEECLNSFVEMDAFETYIGVDGNWNMLLVKTPNGSDLEGKYADEKLLLPFYEVEINENKQDSIK